MSLNDAWHVYLGVALVIALCLAVDIPVVFALVQATRSDSVWPVVAVLGVFLFVVAPVTGFGIAALVAGPLAGMFQ